MAPLVVNLRRNGLMVDWGYYTTHDPKPFTTEDYLAARWVCKPVSLFDADMPVQAASCARSANSRTFSACPTKPCA